MEHRELGLRRTRESSVEDVAEGDVPVAQSGQKPVDEHKEYYTGTVENQVNQSCALRVFAAGNTCQNRYDTGTDIGTHSEEDALVKRDESAHNHCKRNGCHHG